jgi:hypothetical protein
MSLEEDIDLRWFGDCLLIRVEADNESRFGGVFKLSPGLIKSVGGVYWFSVNWTNPLRS